MKMHYTLPAVLLAGILISSPAMIVRANEDGEPGMEHKEHGMEPDHMKKELGLTEDQSAKLKAIRESQKATMKPMMEKQHALMEKLEGQVKSKAGDAEIQTTLTEIRSNRQAMADQMRQFHEQREDVLTPTQQAKLAIKMHEKMEEHHGNRMMRREKSK